MWMKVYLLAAVAALALAACGGSNTPAATDPAATPETASTETPAAPAAIPTALMGPAAGQWEITSKIGDMAVPASKICVDKQLTMEEAQSIQQQTGTSCTDYNFQQAGGAINGTYTCTDATGAKTAVQMTLEGDVNTAYSTNMVMTRDAVQPGVPNPFTITMSAKRLGDCPATP
jgi:hypothetical protein